MRKFILVSLFLAGLAAASLIAVPCAAQTPPLIGMSSVVELTWSAVTTTTDGSPLPVPLVGYEIAITAAGVDLNATPTAASVRQSTGVLGNQGTDITASLKAWGVSGLCRIWVRASDGANWSAWSAPFEVVVIFVAPAAPTGLSIKKT